MVYACGGQQQKSSSIFPNFFREGLSLNLELTITANPQGSKSPESACLFSLLLRLHKYGIVPDLNRALKILAQARIAAQPMLCPLSHHPSLKNYC